MSKIKKTYDVFLSCSLDLIGQAKAITKKFADAGLTVFNISEIEAGSDIVKETWQALAESWALVALIKPGTMPPSVAVEIGAASAWHKPVYIVTEGEAHYHVPSYFSGYMVFRASEIGKVVESISTGLNPLSEKERETLVKAYTTLGVPTDRLLLEPASIEPLKEIVSKESGVAVSGERIMQELLRLRKRGKLPKLRKTN